MIKLQHIRPGRRLTRTAWNRMVDAVNAANNLVVRGAGRMTRDNRGATIQIKGGDSGAGVYIAEVDSDATGGGYYNCHLQTLDATDWDLDTADQLDDKGDSVVVMNVAEIGADRHELEADDRLLCWRFTDDEGNTRYVGIPALRIGTSSDTVNGTSSDTLGGKFVALWLGEW